MKRKEILEKATEIVTHGRNETYSEPENNFNIIAKLWSAYSGHAFSSVDVAMMMALLKIARIKSGTMTEDSFVDGCGYLACGGEIATTVRNIEMTEDSIIFKYENADNVVQCADGVFSLDEYQEHLQAKATAEIKPGGSENEN